MRKHVFWIFAAVSVLFASVPQAQEVEKPKGIGALDGFMFTCLSALVVRDDVVRLARQQGLVEFSHEKSTTFSKTGKPVFATKEELGNGILVTFGDQPTCQVLIRELDFTGFDEKVDEYFGEGTPFTKINHEETFYDVRREYKGDMHGPMALLVSYKKVPDDKGPQGVITLSRIKAD